MLVFLSAVDRMNVVLRHFVGATLGIMVLAVGLQQFMQGEGGSKVQLLMAFASMVIIPVLILYFVTQKQFREGILNAGLKG